MPFPDYHRRSAARRPCRLEVTIGLRARCLGSVLTGAFGLVAAASMALRCTL